MNTRVGVPRTSSSTISKRSLTASPLSDKPMAASQIVVSVSDAATTSAALVPGPRPSTNHRCANSSSIALSAVAATSGSMPGRGPASSMPRFTRATRRARSTRRAVAISSSKLVASCQTFDSVRCSTWSDRYQKISDRIRSASVWLASFGRRCCDTQGLLREREQDLMAAAEVLVKGAVTHARGLHDVGDARARGSRSRRRGAPLRRAGRGGSLRPARFWLSLARWPSRGGVSQNPTRVSKWREARCHGGLAVKEGKLTVVSGHCEADPDARGAA